MVERRRRKRKFERDGKASHRIIDPKGIEYYYE